MEYVLPSIIHMVMVAYAMGHCYHSLHHPMSEHVFELVRLNRWSKMLMINLMVVHLSKVIYLLY